MYQFVRTTDDAEARRVCAPLCTLRPDYAARNRIAPDFELPDLEGKKVRLSDFRGKTVVLNFWTRNCPPCLEEMPALADFARRLASHPEVVLLTISTDDKVEEIRSAIATVVKGPAPFQVLIDPDAKVVTEKFGTKLYPETWFIDPQGVIRARFDSTRDWTQVAPLDLAEMLRDPRHCPLEFSQGHVTSGPVGLCQGLLD